MSSNKSFYRPLASTMLSAFLVGQAYWMPVRANTPPSSKGIVQESSQRRGALLAELRRLSTLAGGEVGIAMQSLGGMDIVSVNGGRPFPMASTFKIAVAATILSMIDDGRLTLDQIVPLALDRYVESDFIATRLIHPGVSLSIYNLLELMLTQSDNTAADSLVELAGGPEGINAWLRGRGIRDQTVNRNTAELIRDFLHLEPGPIDAVLAEAVKKNPSFLTEHVGIDDARFDEDPRDRSTPMAMVKLLDELFQGKALSAHSTAVLIDIMTRCQTGEGRIKGLLPRGTVVAHKTGTLGGDVNDVGVISLPNGERVILAVFVSASKAAMADRERAIAEVSRTVYDYYVLGSRSTASSVEPPHGI